RAVEDLDRVAVRVAELHHLEHATALRLLQRADAKRNACFGELRLHRGELVRACDAEPEIREAVAAILVQQEALMPVVPSQEGTRPLPCVHGLEPEDLRREALPGREIRDAEAEVSQLGHTDCFLHVALLRRTNP